MGFSALAGCIAAATILARADGFVHLRATPCLPPARDRKDGWRSRVAIDGLPQGLPRRRVVSVRSMDPLSALEGMDLSSCDWSQYAFMLPVSICVAFLANTAGIGGAALFAPIYLIVFPALGEKYPLASVNAAVGTALAVEFFGFTSGLVGYARRGFVDVAMALPIILITMPFSFLGANCITMVPVPLLKSAYAFFMLATGIELLSPPELESEDTDAASSPCREAPQELVDSTGRSCEYVPPDLAPVQVTKLALGGALCGLLGVGVGEVVLPLLLRGGSNIPVQIAAGTSVLVVVSSVAAAASKQWSDLLSAGGLSVVPWNLVVWQIPGVIVGAQLAARFQGSLEQRKVERAIGSLFCVIGSAFGWLCLRVFLG